MKSHDNNVITLNDIAEFKNGYAFKSDNYTRNGQYKILTIGNVQDGFIDYSKYNCIDKLPKNIPNHCILKEKDLLMSLTGYVGRIGLVTDKNCLLNQRVCKIVPKQETYIVGLISIFLNEDIKSALNTKSEGGTAQQNLSTKDIEALKVKIGSLEIFKVFCDKHTTLVEIIFNNQKEILNLNKLKQALLTKISKTS